VHDDASVAIVSHADYLLGKVEEPANVTKLNSC